MNAEIDWDDPDSERDSYRPREPLIAPVIEEHEPRPEVVAELIEQARSNFPLLHIHTNTLDEQRCLSCSPIPNPDDLIDAIRWTLQEGYDQTLDIGGPNFTYMARKVYEQHIAKGEA